MRREGRAAPFCRIGPAPRPTAQPQEEAPQRKSSLPRKGGAASFPSLAGRRMKHPGQFCSTQRPASRDVWTARITEGDGGSQVSRAAGAAVVFRDLLCGGPQQVSPLFVPFKSSSRLSSSPALPGAQNLCLQFAQASAATGA